MDRFFIATFGCRTNQADSASIRDALVADGLSETELPEDARIIVVNSCTVTHRSDQQVRQLTRKLRRRNPTARLVVTGCYAQRDPDRLARIAEIDLVIGNTHRHLLPDLVALEGTPGGFGEADAPLARVHREDFPRQRRIAALPAGRIGRRSRPMVKIQDGCDASCSYCIIPAVRGPSRSVPPEEILQQVRELTDQGFREIVLTGIHIGTYGLYLEPRITLDRLLERLVELPRLGLLRLSSIEPMELSRRIIELAARSHRIAPHFHICLQSGSDPVLRAMRRPYSTARFREIVDEIRERIPLAGIGTDVIAGFPGETEADHEATLAFLEGGPFTYLHVFPYSDREGTRAFGLPRKVAPAVIQRRAEELRRLGDRKQREFAKRMVGRELVAVALSESRDGRREVVTANYVGATVDDAVAAGTLFLGRIESFADANRLHFSREIREVRE